MYYGYHRVPRARNRGSLLTAYAAQLAMLALAFVFGLLSVTLTLRCNDAYVAGLIAEGDMWFDASACAILLSCACLASTIFMRR